MPKPNNRHDHLFEDVTDSGFARQLSLSDLTFMGVGGTIGVGIFVLTGVAAAQYAGPAVILSFLFAAFACAGAALCYAELSSMIPSAGSAYTYTLATLGSTLACIVGWNLVLEYLVAASTIAVGWSSYFQSLIEPWGITIPHALAAPPMVCDVNGCASNGRLFNLPAVMVTLFCGFLLYRGTKLSATFNIALTVLKVGVILLVIGFGFAHINPANHTPFIPANTGTYGEYGWSGVIRAAGVVFFAYVGFDMVSTASQEARNPRRDVPLAILFSLIICTLLYVGMAYVMTGMAPYTDLNVANPVYVALDHADASLAWLKPVVSFAATIGLCSAILVTLYGQTRVFYAMARDGFMPKRFADVSGARGVPEFGTWSVAIAAALIAGIFPIELLGELVSIGTLLAFVIVCIGVMTLRISKPDLQRKFRVPAIWIVGPTGVLACLYMMVSLPVGTWIRLAVWMVLGVILWALMIRQKA
jgi:basic amino acid/polyamine antiporter, APA family